MDAERVRAIVAKFAHLEETVQWGENLVFWVGDKAIGGKMFALVDMDRGGGPVMSFSAGTERYAELLEREGVIPAPYMARIHWVALEHWGALDARELAECLANAHAMTYAKLPKRTKAVLAMPAKERRLLVEQRRKALAAAKAAKSEGKKRHSRV
jgi:predicted DNA-binding protein (MmcQ/YjbR family)